MISQLNPIIRGWAGYYRNAVSSRTFHGLDNDLWRLASRWAVRNHPNKPKRWVTARYFGTFNPSRQDRWVFGDRDSGRYLQKFSWTRIVRHRIVAGRASPDDPALADYWAWRRCTQQPLPLLDQAGLRLLHAQHGRCRLCRGLLLHADHEPQSPQQWQQWLTVTRKATRLQAITTDTGPGTPDEPSRSVSSTPTAHVGCLPTIAWTQHFCPPASLQGLPEPCARTTGTHGS